MQRITQRRRKQFSEGGKMVKRATNISRGAVSGREREREKAWKGRDAKKKERLSIQRRLREDGIKEISFIILSTHFT